MYALNRRSNPPADSAAPGFTEALAALLVVRNYLIRELEHTEGWTRRRRFVRRASRRLDRLTALLEALRGGAA